MAWRANQSEWAMEIRKRTTRTTSWTTVQMSSDVAALFLRANRDLERRDYKDSDYSDGSSDSDADTMHLPPGPPPPGPPPLAPRGHRQSSIFEMDVAMMLDPIEKYRPPRRLRAKTSLDELLNEAAKKNKHCEVKSVQDRTARRRRRRVVRKN